VSRGSVLRVLLGDWVYVGVQLFSRDHGLKLVLQQCYASPSPTADTRPIYFLIRDRYVITTIVISSAQKLQRFDDGKKAGTI